MDIIKRLRINGVVNAFMIRDAEVTYSIFAESLHVAEIFKQLITSNYKLCELPFDLRRNGVSIMSLSVEDYQPTEDEEQAMFDIDSAAKLSTEELKSYISVEDVKYLETPPVNYIFNTREEFLHFLENTQVSEVEEIHLPINYFVHPDARFSIQEWRSGEYTKYFRMMENRRNMSYIDYVKLRDWLKQYFPNADQSSGDFIDAYCGWGIDGLNTQFIRKKRKVLTTDMDAIAGASLENFLLYYDDFALVDRHGAIFPPVDVQTQSGWRTNYQSGKEDPLFRKLIRELNDGEYGIARVRTHSSEVAIEMESLHDTFTVTPYRVYCGKTTMINFCVKTFDVTPVSLSAKWWSVRGDERVKTMSELRAIAYEIISQRKRVADVSSFKALQHVGLDVRAALQYMMRKFTADTMFNEDNLPTDADIDFFVAGNYDLDSLPAEMAEKMEYLESCVKGKVNVDRVADGIMSDKAVDVREIYRYLYVLRFCRTQCDMTKLHELANNTDAKVVTHKTATGETMQALPVDVGDGFKMYIPCPVLNAAVEGYNSDLLYYKVSMADKCSCFCKVVRVAREYGTPSNDRHVAFEGLFVKLVSGTKRTVAATYLDSLLKIFDNAVAKLPENQRRFVAPYRRSMCMREYFRVAESGYMQLSKELGGGRVDFSEDFVTGVKSTVISEITTTAAYCRRLWFDGFFTHFCVNADITPFKVYPLSQVTLPEVHVRALWDDLVKMGAGAIVNKLTNEGFLPKGYLPWTYRYVFGKHFTDISDMGTNVDLCNYVQLCSKFSDETKNTEEFQHAPHIETLLYGYYPDETIRVDTGHAVRPEGSVPGISVSSAKFLNKSMFPEHGPISESQTMKVAVLKQFVGFDAEDFLEIPDITKVEMPKLEISDKFLLVDNGLISTESQDNLPYYYIEQLYGKGYPIVRLRGRKYIFRDASGCLWEVLV